MHKFFTDKENISEDNILILGDDVKHISKVLRLRVGDTISISDKCSMEYICTIESIEKKEVSCKILESHKNTTESDVEITLFQGLPKSQKMDLIVQKGTEIGVKKFIPVITKRVVVKTGDKDLTSKLERWNRIAEEAAKQSGRGIVPSIDSLIDFNEAIESLKEYDLAIIPYENEKEGALKNILNEYKCAKKVAIFIGPEGGFEDEEIALAIENKVMPVSLGKRILRTETAGFVASTIVLYEIGDMGGVI